MKKACSLALITLLVFSGCESMQKPPYALAVRNHSFTSDTLFRNIYAATIKVDQTYFPQVSQRSLEKIEMIHRLDRMTYGVERWTMRHDGKSTISYIVNLQPTGDGYVNFTIIPDEGSVPPRENILSPSESRSENPDNLPKAK